MQRPPVSDNSLLVRKMPTDSMSSGEVRSSRGSIEHEYDKLSSFGGSDTRKGIARNICTRLVDAGSTAPTFASTDAEDLPMGSPLGSHLLDAIVGSAILIPILSENYAAGKWCPCEFVQMVENRESTGHVLMPIYEGVENLTGRLGEAFHSHEMCFEQREVEAWQQALRDVSFLQRWESAQIANGVLKRFRPFVSREMAQMK
ncbi:toll/interleukin-1 receptor-like protein isoform X2 [Rhodamnia argentea]|uniref:ADP-ribosyl cyclase/cyclic ADP-ribose hydrolase n=1 Tax=Rhodamnia argentea TaxID=178133 RepID=A0A8B8Q5Q3_9MYRT|nr:toll/interleukin-1 receptor-like protein isoform X2 [Rhodamnia argentea]